MLLFALNIADEFHFAHQAVGLSFRIWLTPANSTLVLNKLPDRHFSSNYFSHAGLPRLFPNLLMDISQRHGAIQVAIGKYGHDSIAADVLGRIDIELAPFPPKY